MRSIPCCLNYSHDYSLGEISKQRAQRQESIPSFFTPLLPYVLSDIAEEPAALHALSRFSLFLPSKTGTGGKGGGLRI